MANSKSLILIIEDSAFLLESITSALRKEYKHLMAFSCVEDALPHLNEADLIVSDFQMPGLGGAGLINHMLQTAMRPLLIMTALDIDAPELEEAKSLGIPILSKPFSLEQLREAIKRILEDDA